MNEESWKTLNKFHDDLIIAIEEYENSPEGKTANAWKKYLEEFQEERFQQFEKWLEHNDFDKLIYRLISEHDADYRDSWYERGIEPQPNNKLQFLLDYVDNRCKITNVKKLDCGFNNQIRLFKGYYFQTTHGQGTVTDIYNKKKLQHLLHV